MRQKIKLVVQALSDSGSFLQLHQVSSCRAPGLSCCPLGSERTAKPKGCLGIAGHGWNVPHRHTVAPGQVLALRRTDGHNTKRECKNEWGPNGAFLKKRNPFA